MTEGAHELRCGGCNYWLGESAVELVRVQVMDRGQKAADVSLRPPRDLRLCRKCRRVNVYVLRSDLDLPRAAPVASA